jgi:hypothetical protein
MKADELKWLSSSSVFHKPALCQGTTLQAAEKLIEHTSKSRFVSGHDFSRAEKGPETEGFNP